MLAHINANSERHPWYGPCDAIGKDGSCCECDRMIGLLPTLERRANEAEAKGKRVLARLIKAREFLPMDMRAYQELQDAINELQQ